MIFLLAFGLWYICQQEMIKIPISSEVEKIAQDNEVKVVHDDSSDKLVNVRVVLSPQELVDIAEKEKLTIRYVFQQTGDSFTVQTVTKQYVAQAPEAAYQWNDKYSIGALTTFTTPAAYRTEKIEEKEIICKKSLLPTFINYGICMPIFVVLAAFLLRKAFEWCADEISYQIRRRKSKNTS